MTQGGERSISVVLSTLARTMTPPLMLSTGELRGEHLSQPV